MGGVQVCIACGEKFWQDKVQERAQHNGEDTDKRIILKWIFTKQDDRM
jgi:hypothetical protein